jgi:hypothetical protein
MKKFIIIPTLLLVTLICSGCSAKFQYAMERECGINGTKSAQWVGVQRGFEKSTTGKNSNEVNEILITCNNGQKHRTKVE